MENSNAHSIPGIEDPNATPQHSPTGLQKEDKRPWLRKFQWKPGESGNKSGKRQGQKSVTAALKRELEKGETASKVARKIIESALSGDTSAMKLLLDRTDGLLTRQLEAHIQGQIAMPTVQNVIFQLPPNGRERMAVAEVPPSEAAPLPPNAS